MKKNTAFMIALLTSSAFAINSAQAAVITSSADSLLAGGTVETFDAAPSGTHSSITLGNVTYSVEPGALLTIGTPTSLVALILPASSRYITPMQATHLVS